MDVVSWVALAVAVVSSLTALSATWIRARWHLHQEKARSDSLIAIAEALPAGGRLRDQRADGSYITLTVPTHGGFNG
ncbi:hypothetical protein DDE19_25925 [Micromonospora ureilytica]|uniref:Uncharacterized protein n=1 Tax=Micromonospora ureilytica TaxID=709868 RepID=A0A3N9XJY3_9ACTN|nr:hypothetical protein [Micromonospora ureilytica]RQX13381.1 hypothetical protein DDE19_25925 [Micromonospora ureilytica]